MKKILAILILASFAPAAQATKTPAQKVAKLEGKLADARANAPEKVAKIAKEERLEGFVFYVELPFLQIPAQPCCDCRAWDSVARKRAGVWR